MNIKLFKPKNDLLKRYINYYYWFEQGEGQNTSYLTFPNPNSILSVLQHVKITHAPNAIHASFSRETQLVSDLTISYQKPILINYEGIIKEISICFKPLGINAFIPDPRVSTIAERFFEPYPDFLPIMEQVIQAFNHEQKVDILDDYFMAKYNDIDHPFLHGFVQDALNETKISIADLSDQYQVSPKTLIKHTKMYLGRTPSEFIKVCRFHRAMREYFKDQSGTFSLTEISHAVSFFDQAHMIKDFKALTGFTPSAFFQKMNPTEGELNWVFL